MKDLIYAQPQQVSDFRFDDSVAEVFPDMIQRSVPGYTTIIDGIGQLTQQFATDDSCIYDLGCSLGAASLAVSKYVRQDCQVFAVDNSQAMVSRCEKHLQAFKTAVPIDVICADILEQSINNASVVILNFTLQFIPPHEREALLAKIHAGLNPGGVLLLSEKVNAASPRSNETLINLHHEFKRRNGYSELEISQKRTALENVMQLDTLAAHQQRLQNVGFVESVVWFQCFNFIALLARKEG